jgi:hypothetical protein
MKPSRFELVLTVEMKQREDPEVPGLMDLDWNIVALRCNDLPSTAPPLTWVLVEEAAEHCTERRHDAPKAGGVCLDCLHDRLG